ncbi:MAG: pectin acetylesterase-family hydrolase [Polyangiales bacterium]
MNASTPLSSSRRFLVTATVMALSLGACGPVSMTMDASPDAASSAETGAPEASLDGSASDGAAPMDDAAVPADAYPGMNWDVAPLPPGMPISATMEQWTWVQFPEARCGTGTATGIAVNLTNRSNKVFVYMMGGGACWDQATCYELRTAANLEGYSEANFTRDRAQFDAAGMFNRDDMTNPFRDASYVFIPYCTGDVHGGNRIAVHDTNNPDQRTYHVGANNVALYLQRLVPTFANADRVWLTGSSAGGVGATLNWPRFQEAFPRARVDLLNDGGQLCDANNGRAAQWRRAWSLPVPPGCPECATSLQANMVWMHRTMGATRRSGLMATLQDSTLRGFYTVTPATFETATRALLTAAYDPNMNTRYFVLPGSMHTYWGRWSMIMAADGTRVRDWITAWATDDPTWRNVGP